MFSTHAGLNTTEEHNQQTTGFGAIAAGLIYPASEIKQKTHLRNCKSSWTGKTPSKLQVIMDVLLTCRRIGQREFRHAPCVTLDATTTPSR